MANVTFGINTHLADSVFGLSQAPITSFIQERAEEMEKKSVLPELFNIEKTNKYMEKFTAMTAMSGFLPTGPENGTYPIDGIQESYSKTFEQMEWLDSFTVTRVAVEDAVAMDLRKKPQSFTTGYYRTREEFGAALFGGAIKLDDSITINGQTFSCQTADGVDLFSAAHPSKVTGAVQSNYFADAFSLDAMSYMESKMQDFRGDNNNILAISPNTILIPNDPALKKAVMAAIGSDKDPDTANNGFNFQYGKWRIVIWAYLNKYITASTKPWVMIDSAYNEEYTGAVWLDRVPLSVESDIDPTNGANIWRGRARFTAGFNDWRFAAVGGVAAGTALL